MFLSIVRKLRGGGVALLCASAVVCPAAGQTKDSTAPPPVVVGGYVDAYYSYNLANPPSGTNQLRNFDVTHNQLVVSAAEVSVTRAASPVGFRVDADFGPTNDIVQSNATGSIANIGQAFITYVAPLGNGLTIDAGKFVTHMGIEVIKAKDDYNYSRSILFAYAIPYYHLGARASYPVSTMLTVNGYLLNCWNGVPTTSQKTFGFSAVFTPISVLSVTGNWIGGRALPDTVSKKFRNVGEVIVSYQAAEAVVLAADGVYGQENLPSGVALWKGIAGYARYAVCAQSALTLRGEVYSDPQGYTTGTVQDIKEVTFTYEYKGLSNLILRGEYRYDWSGAVVYDGSGGQRTRRNQATIAAGAIVVF